MKPLEGKRILVTRRPEQAGPLVDGLRALGAVPILAPMIRILEPDSWDACDRALAALDEYSGFGFASANGAEKFLQRAFDRGRDARDFDGRTVLAVGPATARTLDGFGVQVSMTPAEHSAAALVDAMRGESVTGMRFLLPRGDRGRRELAEGLRDLGASVDEVVVYRIVRPEEQDLENLRAMLERGEVDMLTFASPSAVHHFAGELGGADLSAVVLPPIAAIGPTTAAAVRGTGWDVAVVSHRSTAEGLLASIEEYFRLRQ